MEKLSDGINLIQECFKKEFHPSNMMITNDSKRSFTVTISPVNGNHVSPMINQDNLEFLIKKGFRITNIWSDAKKGLIMVLYQVVQN